MYWFVVWSLVVMGFLMGGIMSWIAGTEFAKWLMTGSHCQASQHIVEWKSPEWIGWCIWEYCDTHEQAEQIVKDKEKSPFMFRVKYRQ